MIDTCILAEMLVFMSSTTSSVTLIPKSELLSVPVAKPVK